MSSPLQDLFSQQQITALARAWLEEDTPNFDCGKFVVGKIHKDAKLLIKSPGVVAGVPFFDAVFKEVGCEVQWSDDLIEGDYIACKSPTRIATVRGACKDILQGERVALNCLCRASGIATVTRKFIEQIHRQGWSGKVAATRNTTPGFRLVEKYSALVAGADTHRFDVSSMVILRKSNIWATRNIFKEVEKVKKVAGFSLKIEVECRSLDEGLEAATAGADMILFDSFLPEELHKAAESLKMLYPSVVVEASGEINEHNISSYCGPHVDLISTSRITEGYPVVDFSLKIVRENEC